MSIFISKVIFLFVYYFVKVFCRYYILLAGQKIKFCTSNFICIFINVLLFTLIQVDEFITSTLSISQNIKNSLEGRHIRFLHAGGRHPRIGPGPFASEGHWHRHSHQGDGVLSPGERRETRSELEEKLPGAQGVRY